MSFLDDITNKKFYIENAETISPNDITFTLDLDSYSQIEIVINGNSFELNKDKLEKFIKENLV